MCLTKKLSLIFGTLLLITSINAMADQFSAAVDDKGNISLPENFREEMVHIGSWFVPDGDASGLHDVFTEKASFEAYRETGAFPDGATLVKEVRGHTTGDYTTGAGVSHSQDVKLWFVMVRDTQNRFPGNEIWAEGWGWALIKTDDVTKNTATSFEADCKGCHIPARENNWVFVEGYPSLKE